MNKQSRMKKHLIKEGVVLAGVLLAAAALCFGATTFTGSKEEDSRKLQSSIQQTDSQISDMERKINLVQSSVEQYRVLKKELDAKHYLLDREQIRLSLDEMRRRFRLSNLKLDVTAEQAFDDPQLQIYPTTQAVYSDVKIEFGAISDLHFYAFLDALPKSLSGFVKLNEVKVTRNHLLTTETLTELAKGSETDQVQASVSFLWIGLRPKSANTTGAPGAP